MKILVINAGSSSLKYQLIEMEDESVIAKGNCDKIGVDGHIKHTTYTGYVFDEDCDFPTHTEAFEKLVEVLMSGENAVINDVNEISAIGHRIVQGADLFKESVLVDDEVIEKIESISDLAPLHNPAHVLAIRACRKVFGTEIPETVVFDTSFHSTMPAKAYMFGVPYEYYEKYAVRKYGFHGTSHRFVSKKLAKILGKDPSELKIVTCHLGNGSSIAAVDSGKVVDTSMGFTPLDGLLMGTRCGAVDPSVIYYLAEKENLDPNGINTMCNKKSGYLGISGVSADHRDLCDAASKGNERAQLALDMQAYQIQKYIGSYAAAMNGLDAVLFTGGIGENSVYMRKAVCTDMEYFGIKLDDVANIESNGKVGKISTKDSKTEVWVVPTNEELLIARDTLELISK